MYNFSGVIYRIWAVCGFIFLLGLLIVIFQQPWRKPRKLKEYAASLLLICSAVFFASIYASRIVFPKIEVYTGEFVSSHPDHRVAPPLPFTNEYVFWNVEGKKQAYYLDVFSKKEIFPYDFEKYQVYTIYFDDFSNVIVKVEKIESK